MALIERGDRLAMSRPLAYYQDVQLLMSARADHCGI